MLSSSFFVLVFSPELDSPCHVFSYAPPLSQSPVDVRTLAPPLNMETNVRYDPYLSGIKLEYDSLTSLSLQNVGHSLILPIRMTTPATQSDAGTWTLTHGARQYDLESMTFHVAGEHTYDGKRPSMEMHLIHRAHDAGARG